MANAITGNKIYIDTTGQVTEKRTLVAYIILTAHENHTELTLKETSGGATSMVLDVDSSYTTQVFDFSAVPLIFNNGIHATITSGSHATLVTVQPGGPNK